MVTPEQLLTNEHSDTLQCITGYTLGMDKDPGLSIGMQCNLRERLQKVGSAQDKSAAQVDRELIRPFNDHQDRMQGGSAVSDAGLREGGNGLA